jgi:hypothetical protein
VQCWEGHGGHGQGPQLPSAGEASRPAAAPPLRRTRGRQQPTVPKTGNWTNSQLQAALTAHERGCFVSRAATLYNIPRTSFRAYLAGIVTQGRETPFTNGVPGIGWLRWFRKRYPELSVRLAQGLDVSSLCAVNVSSFYEDLSSLYTKYQYSPLQIWN